MPAASKSLRGCPAFSTKNLVTGSRFLAREEPEGTGEDVFKENGWFADGLAFGPFIADGRDELDDN